MAVILLRVPATLAYRDLAFQAVTTACREWGVDTDADGESLETQVVSAFVEAFSNITRHAYPSGQPGEVAIAIRWSDDEFVLETTDAGRSFDFAGVPLPDLDALPEGGMGVFIMRSLMDEVVYRPGPPNVLRPVKRRGARARDGRARATSHSGWRMKAVCPADEALAGASESVTLARSGAADGARSTRRDARGGTYSIVVRGSRRR